MPDTSQPQRTPEEWREEARVNRSVAQAFFERARRKREKAAWRANVGGGAGFLEWAARRGRTRRVKG